MTFMLPLAFLCAAALALAADPPAPGVSVTVYSSADPAGFDPQQFVAQQRLGGNPMFAWQVPGFGVVKEIRTVDMQDGAHTLRFTDVAAFIDPTTVSFTDLTDPSTAVLEQNFEFDLVSPAKLLEKYLDREVLLVRYEGESRQQLAGTLLSASGGQLVLKSGSQILILPQEGTQVALGDLPGGLITKPTLVWKLQGGSAGEHLVRTTYQTSGITWKADYNLILADDETSADLAAWVTLLNMSGAAYENANLKLVAGDVQRVQPAPPRYMRAGQALGVDMAAEGFEEKSFFEYHLYTLPRRTDILANTTQQLVLFPTATGVPVEKVLVYDGAAALAGWGYADEPYVDRGAGAVSQSHLDVYLRFVNDEASHLGRPLPRGKIRVYKQDDADGTLEFVGEDLIDHTPRNEKVKVRLGRSFDVVGERTQTDFSIDTSRRTITESFRVEVRNRKNVPQQVIVREHLFRWATWEIVKKSADFRKVDARTVEWTLDVPADGVGVVEYTVRYTW